MCLPCCRAVYLLPVSPQSADNMRLTSLHRAEGRGRSLSLAQERLNWRAGLAEILHPAGDLAMEVQDTGLDRAHDLKYTLLSLQRQCDATWPVRPWH